jgi:hypothetical protein
MRSHVITNDKIEGFPAIENGIVRLEAVWFGR